MTVNNIRKGESITFTEIIGKGHDYQGFVLGVERDYVWVIIPEIKDVFQFSPTNIFVREGKNCFSIYDRRKSVNFVVNVAPGDLDGRFFEYSKNEKVLIQLVKAYHLILPQ